MVHTCAITRPIQGALRARKSCVCAFYVHITQVDKDYTQITLLLGEEKKTQYGTYRSGVKGCCARSYLADTTPPIPSPSVTGYTALLSHCGFCCSSMCARLKSILFLTLLFFFPGYLHFPPRYLCASVPACHLPNITHGSGERNAGEIVYKSRKIVNNPHR